MSFILYVGKLKKFLKHIKIKQLSRYLDNEIVVMPQGYKSLAEEDSYEPTFNLYKIIEDKVAILKDEGASFEYIKKFITAYITIHLKCFYKKNKRILLRIEKKYLNV